MSLKGHVADALLAVSECEQRMMLMVMIPSERAALLNEQVQCNHTGSIAVYYEGVIILKGTHYQENNSGLGPESRMRLMSELNDIDHLPAINL